MSEKADESGLIQQLKAGKGFLSWRNARDMVLFALILIVAWKLLGAEIKIDFGDFKFTDLLALLLALFSVWLSVLFYFKADEASGRFYDNSYKFTRDMSEILGRIEAGFGERLRHLDEGYSGIREAVGRLPGIHAKAEVEEAKVHETEAEVKKIIDELAQRANLAEGERLKVLEDLRRLNEELKVARDELSRLRQLERDEQPMTLKGFSALTLIRATMADLLNLMLAMHSREQIEKASAGELMSWAHRASGGLESKRLSFLQATGLAHADGLLTQEGIKELRRALSRKFD